VTFTVCEQVAVLPLLSVTVQITVVVPTGKDAGALLLTVATAQLSDVVGVPKATPVAVQPLLAVVFTVPGQLIVGGTLSPFITVCVVVVVQLFASFTVMVYAPAVRPVNIPDDAPVVFTVGPAIT
jgi:hypothetical protein